MPWHLTHTLQLEAVYIAAAREALSRAEAGEAAVLAALRRAQEFEEEDRQILARHGGDIVAAYDEQEDRFGQVEGILHETERAYEPFIANLAVTHLLCAAALESHINGVASQELGPTEFLNFDKLSLEGKWLLLPRVLGRRAFSPGEEPFQGLRRLVKFRNALTHFKRRVEEYSFPGIPRVLPALGLTLADARRSLRCAIDLAAQLASTSPTPPPFGPTGLSTHAFALSIAERPEAPCRPQASDERAPAKGTSDAP